MYGILSIMVVYCLLGASANPGAERAMGGLYWCETLCMCSVQSNEHVQCFERTELYELLSITKRQVGRLERNDWYIEDHLRWCTDTCLCHKRNDREFKCTEEQKLVNFINETIGDAYFYRTEEADRPVEVEHPIETEEEQADPEPEPELHPEPEPEQESHPEPEPEPESQLEPEPESQPEPEHQKRSERRRGRKNRNKKKNRGRHGEEATTEIPEDYTNEPEPEVEPEAEPTSYQAPEPIEMINTTNPAPEHQAINPDEVDAEEIERSEELPRQEAVAASPAVTGLQPPTRRQPFPTTLEPYTPRASSSREVSSSRVQPILEVPKEKKTVASKVSQDLNELGSTVDEIKSDVVLNQKILLITAGIAGVAMLGVLILAIHGCASRRHQHQHRRNTNQTCDGGPTKDDDNPVTKLNIEEAW